MKTGYTLLVSVVALDKQSMTFVGGCKLPSLLQAPGDGINQVIVANDGNDGTVNAEAPFASVYKDGFWNVGCIADEMIETGDKFGAGKFAYDAARSANTSVVWYGEILDKQHQRSMSATACFDFCRTVPDMTFFGLVHGRDCYCSSYYRATSGEGSCDIPCSGGGACGGKSKSTLYEMHKCEGGLKKKVDAVMDEMTGMYNELEQWEGDLTGATDAMQGGGDTLEALGEGSASDFAQLAKVAAGPIDKSARAVSTVLKELKDLDQRGALKWETDGEELQYADREAAEKLLGEVEAAYGAAKGALASAAPEFGPGAGYVPTMRQVDAKYKASQVVCNGDGTGSPKVGLTLEECYTACDSEAPASSADRCKFVQFFTFAEKDSLCFLMTGINAVTTFDCEPGTADSPNGFLQLGAKTVRKLGKKPSKVLKLAKPAAKKLAKDAKAVSEDEKEELRAKAVKTRALVAHRVQRTISPHSAKPVAQCHARFADVNGVTPKVEETHVAGRCFGDAVN